MICVCGNLEDFLPHRRIQIIFIDLTDVVKI